MKRVISVVLAVLVLMSALSVSVLCANAADTQTAGTSLESGDYVYKLLPDSTVEITAYNGTDKTELTIPSTIDGYKVSTLGQFSFLLSDELESITIADGITKIDHSAITACTSLKTVSIPESVTLMYCDSISYNNFLESIVVDTNNKNYCSEDGVLFDKNKTQLMTYPMSKMDSAYTVPSTVKTIAPEAFFCSVVETVTLPQGIKEIGKSAFENCLWLLEVNLPVSLNTVGERAFFYCEELKGVNIPIDVTTIGDKAFGYIIDFNELGDEVEIVDTDFTITGASPSTAKTYADDNGIRFVLDGPISAKYLLGDSDLDTAVTVLDATNIQRYLAKLAAPNFSELNSDVDEDGDVTVLDATIIQKYMAKIETNTRVGTYL